MVWTVFKELPIYFNSIQWRASVNTEINAGDFLTQSLRKDLTLSDYFLRMSKFARSTRFVQNIPSTSLEVSL
jgi:hypothetical protein